jgi:ribosomal protein S18 acetylase RimI-like enzyme
LARMADPFEALTSFQEALSDGEINLRAAELDPDLFLHVDQRTGITRLTYVRLNRQLVTAMAIMVGTEPMHGLPCFQAGVAVPPAYRGRGYAKSVLAAAIAELKHGLTRNKISSFYIEAIVSIDNEPSKRVAEATISSTPVAVTDEGSGQPALQYVRKV